MKPTNTPNQQILTLVGPEPTDCFLLAPGPPTNSRLKYEVLRNDKLVANIPYRLFGRPTPVMCGDDKQGAQKKVETTRRMGWHILRTRERAQPNVEWKGVRYLYGSLELQNESHADVINELVATWAIYEYKTRLTRILSGHEGYHTKESSYSHTEFTIASQHNSKAVKTIGATTQTLPSLVGGVSTPSEGGTGSLMEVKLAIGGVTGVTASDGKFGAWEAVHSCLEDHPMVRMKDAMTQTDPQPPAYRATGELEVRSITGTTVTHKEQKQS